MERQFKNRSEQIEWYAKQRGWEPLTEEDKVALDDAVRMITNLDQGIMRYLIDTHIFIWRAREKWKLTPDVLALIDDYGKQYDE